MATINTSKDYFEIVDGMAHDLAVEAMQETDNNKDDALELLNDSLLHETVDGCEYVIYNHYHLPIIQYSGNCDYYIDNFGGDDAAYVIKEKGLDHLHMTIAYWCLYADIQELLEEKLDDIVDNLHYDDFE